MSRHHAAWKCCVNCDQPLYPRPAYATDEGFAHVTCPPGSKLVRAARIEDLTWLADNGVGLSEAARRCGWDKADSLDKWCRYHAPDLRPRLMANEPRDHNQPAAELAGTRRAA